jgi:hypothetical protein
VGASAGLAALLEVLPIAKPLTKSSSLSTMGNHGGDDGDDELGRIERENFARRLAYWSTAAFFALLVLQVKRKINKATGNL